MGSEARQESVESNFKETVSLTAFGRETELAAWQSVSPVCEVTLQGSTGTQMSLYRNTNLQHFL